ncbi:alpha-(1,3)-fucosyltransferase C-like isoform X2 [Macrobrachium nipponense]|uniref:alpha-(1,3)-fucosyltransferase C-like isoform X2 n=1 Tax=Macrobrachium nipponense TaxID=159736 RepID=UPI0030C81E16
MTLEDAPQYRTPSQRWVWVTLEAPRGGTGVHDLDVIRRENLHHLINWTMTYNRPLRPNLSSSYPGVIRKYLDSLRKNMTLADVMGPAWREFVNRPKLVSWVVSHCRTISKREQYVDELVKYAPVDIYGRCGTLDCFPKNPFHECWNHTMGRLYLFYLALENDLCDDYISEKLYRALYYKLVPVVWGGNGYEDVMVPGSYINARHYHPKDLAKLLLDLQEDPVAYGRYHLWRGFWDLKLGGSMCELCHKLHTDKEPKHYTDIPAWRLKSNRCFQVPNNLFMDPENPDAWKEVISSNEAI